MQAVIWLLPLPRAKQLPKISTINCVEHPPGLKLVAAGRYLTGIACADDLLGRLHDQPLFPSKREAVRGVRDKMWLFVVTSTPPRIPHDFGT